MSSQPLKVSIISEGKTDFVVLCAAIESLLQGADFEATLLQPEYPFGTHAPGPTGEGWSGVYRWCQQMRSQGEGRVSGAPILADVVIIQVDADVAAANYNRGHIDDHTGDLPCDVPCPPASDTTDALRRVLLRWCGEQQLAEGFIFCTPSKSMETWVMATLFPADRSMKNRGWECHDDPEGRLAAQPSSQRVPKTVASYRQHAASFRDNWPRVRKLLNEAERFSTSFEATGEVTRMLARQTKST